MLEKIQKLFDEKIDDYIKWQKSSEWDEAYKWDILAELSSALEQYNSANAQNINDIISLYQKHNPQSGQFVRFTYFSDLEEGLKSNTELVADFINKIWTREYERANEIYTSFSYNKRSLGTPGMGYFSAGKDPVGRPLFRGEFLDGLTTTLDLQAEFTSNSDKYRYYCEAVDAIAELLLPALKSNNYSESFYSYPAICAQDFLYFNFFNWSDKRLLYFISKFIDQADSNSIAGPQASDLSKKQYAMHYETLKVSVSFGQGAAARVPWFGFDFGNKYGFSPTLLYYPEHKTLLLTYDSTKDKAPEYSWQGVDNYQTVDDYFADKNISDPGTMKYGDSRVYKSYDTNDQLPETIIEDIKHIVNEYKKQLTNIRSNQVSLPEDILHIRDKVKSFMDNNPEWREDNESWSLRQGQIDDAVNDFQEKFSPDKLSAMTDDEILRWIPYRQDTTKDGLSYTLEFGPVIGKIGGIGGGSAGKMGYYQGKDGEWKTLKNKVTTREDVLRHRRIDIEILNVMYGHIASDDFSGLRDYINGLRNHDGGDEDRYKEIVPGLVWVRKYFMVMFPEKFIAIYGAKFIKLLEDFAQIGSINAGGQDWDYSLWYEKMNRISLIAADLNITNYELSKILWKLIQGIHSEGNGMSYLTDITLNTILYGPPGTGKTYRTRQLAEPFTRQSRSKDKKRIDIINDFVTEATLYDVIGFTMAYTFDDKQSVSVTDLLSSELIRHRFDNTRPKNERSSVWGRLQLHTSDDCPNVNYAKRSAPHYFWKEPDSTWRLVDDEAKQEILDKYADVVESLDRLSEDGVDEEANFVDFITFHQSYSYEEFVEGIRPDTSDEEESDGSLRYVMKDGVFKQVCKKAQQDPDNNYLLIIDEINRGNISKIFGELITLLEPNKRLGADEELIVTLPYSQKPFGVPKNVYVLGTMNTADRSIALLDVALRRRFDFVELMPDYKRVDFEVDGVHIGALLELINNKIEVMTSRDYQIGHSYLMHAKTTEELHKAWYNRVMPLLLEYFYNDWEKLIDVVGKYQEQAQTGFIDIQSAKHIQRLFGTETEYSEAVVGNVKEYSPQALPSALKALYETQSADKPV